MFLDLAGIRVQFETAGQGPPVLLLHGWGAKAQTMRSILGALEQDHEVWALDFPGFGESPPPPVPWGVGEYTSLVVAFLDALGVQCVSVVGHSFGGRVGIKLAATQPERVDRLVLVDSAGIRNEPPAGRSLRQAGIRAGKAILRSSPFGGLREKVEAAARQRLGSEDYRTAGPLRETFLKVIGEDLRHHLPAIKAPTLLIWGSLDEDTPVADARLMEASIPDAGLVVLPGAGHYSYLDRPAEFNRIVRTFLA